MAYIRKLPSGNWQATVRHPDLGRIPRTDPLRKVVKEWAEEAEADIRRGIWKDPRRKTVPTLTAWYETWTKGRIVEAETARADEGSWRLHIVEHLGKRRLDDIARSDVQAWVAGRVKAGVGRSAVRRALNHLKACLEGALDDDLIQANPARKVDPPKVTEKLPDWYTRDEVKAITAEMRKRGWESQAVMTELMCWLGLRWGEASALTGADVDWLRRRVLVTHVLTQAGKDKPYPKTSSSNREVPAPKWLLDNMSELLKDRERDSRIFVTRRGGRNLSGSNWRTHTWEPVLEAAKIDHGTPHTCRHTAASWLVQARTPLYDVKRLLGHSSMTVTERYSHLDPDQHDAVTGAWKRIDAHVTHAKRRKAKKAR